MNPEKVRCQIIEYTKHEMYLHGADGLTMDDIAKGMKMSKRTLYKLFPSKTCLFRICLSDFTNGTKSDADGQFVYAGAFCHSERVSHVIAFVRKDFIAGYRRERRLQRFLQTGRGLLVAAVYRRTDAL